MMTQFAIRIFVIACVGAALFGLPATALPVNTGPPAGIVATTSTLDQVLSARDTMLKAHKWSSMVEQGTFTEHGLHGTYRESISNYNYKWTENLGGFTTQRGELDGQAWSQNENGIVTLEHNVHQAGELALAALERHTQNNNVGLTLSGESTSPVAYVIEIHASGGRHQWRFYDKRTYQLLRVESIHPTTRIITTYDDFRTADGVTFAWHTHIADGHPENDTDYVTTSVRFNVGVSSADLAIPPSNMDLVQFPAGAQSVRLPAKLVPPGRIVVRVTIGGRGLDFQLDSGSSGILMDGSAARSLGLKPVGESLQTAGGAYKEQTAVVPEMRIGDIVMKNVVVDTAGYAQQENADMKVVGLLGFDFIANTALKIDYYNGTVDAIPPYLFVPPAEAMALDALWDDGVPRVGVTVTDVPANFILDTGADDGVIFSQFALAHPDAVKDQGRGAQMSSYLPYWLASGVGGKFSIQPIQIKKFMVASATYNEFVMYEVLRNPGFEGEDYDGLLGYEFLQYFTVYLDYKDLHVYLVLNRKAH